MEEIKSRKGGGIEEETSSVSLKGKEEEEEEEEEEELISPLLSFKTQHILQTKIIIR